MTWSKTEAICGLVFGLSHNVLDWRSWTLITWSGFGPAWQLTSFFLAFKPFQAPGLMRLLQTVWGHRELSQFNKRNIVSCSDDKLRVFRSDRWNYDQALMMISAIDSEFSDISSVPLLSIALGAWFRIATNTLHLRVNDAICEPVWANVGHLFLSGISYRLRCPSWWHHAYVLR